MLVIPTSGRERSHPDVLHAKVFKGQLYNLDTDEKLWFQFNPEQFEFEQEIVWDRINPPGMANGGNPRFIHTGPYEFDLPFLFIADPSAPLIEYEAKEDGLPVHGAYRLGEYKFLLNLLERWKAVILGKRRPPHIGVMMKDKMFEGVVTNWKYRETEWFESGDVRESLITISFAGKALYANQS